MQHCMMFTGTLLAATLTRTVQLKVALAHTVEAEVKALHHVLHLAQILVSARSERVVFTARGTGFLWVRSGVPFFTDFGL